MSFLLHLALLAPAHAQDAGFDAHGFQLTGLDADPRDALTVARPGRLDANSWYAGGLVEYASRPLIFEPTEGETQVVLRDLVALDLAAGFTPHERIRLDVFAPLYITSDGLDGPQGASVGDVRLSALAPLIAPDTGGGPGVGLLAFADLPTGNADQFLGQAGLGGGLAVVATLEQGPMTVSGNAGLRFSPNSAPEQRPVQTRGGDAALLAGSAGYSVDERTAVHLELRTDLELDPVIRTAVGTASEALISVRHARYDGGHVTGGLGVGLGNGAGASPIRLVVGGGFGSAPPPPTDSDGDGIVDRDDACVDTPETMNGFEDEDGCPDGKPKVAVRAMLDGAVAADADIRVIQADGQAVDGRSPLELTGLPGEKIEATATLGDCHDGAGSGAIGRESGTVDIELEKRFGTVKLTVHDPDGAPIEAASVRYEIADSRCAPADSAVAGGSASHEVGVGAAVLHVLADGYGPARVELQMEQGATEEIDVELKSSKVRVTEKAIVIDDKVFFETGKATILPKSHPLLGDVASTILAHDVKQVEVQGHTDNRGPDQMNLELSQARAESVRTFLIEAGVPGDRLKAAGFGETQPIEDNKTSGGRSRNRRVEFKIPAKEGAGASEEAKPAAPEEGAKKTAPR